MFASVKYLGHCKGLTVLRHYTNGTLILNAACHKIIYDQMLKILLNLYSCTWQTAAKARARESHTCVGSMKEDRGGMKGYIINPTLKKTYRISIVMNKYVSFSFTERNVDWNVLWPFSSQHLDQAGRMKDMSCHISATCPAISWNEVQFPPD